ncbi:hypothetical protein PSMA106859_08975 [Pseudoalteromonas maricaloris]
MSMPYSICSEVKIMEKQELIEDTTPVLLLFKYHIVFTPEFMV